VLLLRRLDVKGQHGWLDAVKLLEPILTMLWHMALDVPRWLRFGRILGVPAGRRVLLLPVVGVMSLLARGGEMVGMVQTIASPEAMKRFAESN